MNPYPRERAGPGNNFEVELEEITDDALNCLQQQPMGACGRRDRADRPTTELAYDEGPARS